ncbi:hypothetical protein I302_103842 [Kwoniella bestiolae CBS 10118]|uniref:Uncharacterized protein n=1 Tax=Kwoniella bestiolae CBS 10118 TaxID=1296100 RepID=A0A1B9G9P7_9TREE|nr:hypothetical protein I302_02545 [Kwoniella bestiolae CBS 10118]OCF27700.1 hypothetical protein I302_02545 [Kwoniella bestiolae CBS 10118]
MSQTYLLEKFDPEPGDQACQLQFDDGFVGLTSWQGGPPLAKLGYLSQASPCPAVEDNGLDMIMKYFNDEADPALWTSNEVTTIARKIRSIRRGWIDDDGKFKPYRDIRSFEFDNQSSTWNDQDDYHSALGTWMSMTDTGKTNHSYSALVKYHFWRGEESKEILKKYQTEKEEKESGILRLDDEEIQTQIPIFFGIHTNTVPYHLTGRGRTVRSEYCPNAARSM